MAHSSITRLGSNLHFWRAGPPAAPRVVLLHGATLDHRSFEAQVPALVEAGFQVLLPDLRGHGLSTPMGIPLSVGILADDLLAVLDELKSGPVALLGHSFGGFVAQAFIQRYPGRVHNMALVGCTDLAQKPKPGSGLLYRLFTHLLPRMQLETFRQRTLANLSRSPEVKVYAAQTMAGISKDDFIAITLAGIAALWLDSGFEPGSIIPVPCLLTHGDQDAANGGVYPRQARAWAKRQPNCRYEVIPAAGHTAHMDNPAAFNLVYLDFLQQHRRTA